MTHEELKQKWFAFFSEKKHSIIPSSSLIPENDPTVLFTTAGMHPLIPFLLGQTHTRGKRLANVQKCVRTGDIAEVGDDTHLTFFEMLGNWSLGDYFKKESIAWSWEFLTDAQWLGISPNKLSMTYFAGDENAPTDNETKELWLSLGVAPHRVIPLPAEDNWWPTAAVPGPCGPDTEIFYWTGEGDPPYESHPGNDKRWVEIWNNVFMQFERLPDLSLRRLPAPNVDTGMGLERTVAVLSGVTSVYEAGILKDIMTVIRTWELQGGGDGDARKEKERRVIADHVRTAVMILGDERGVEPGNTGQGYVLRRLIRRAVRASHMLGKNLSIAELVPQIQRMYQADYPSLESAGDRIRMSIAREEEKFTRTIASAEKEALRIASQSGEVISGKDAFRLYESYGLPWELTQEITGKKVEVSDFEEALRVHQELSRQNAPGEFKGGLATHSIETTRLHTATHLLHQALRLVLGTHVTQRGSNITPERLRFDFSHPKKMTPEEIARVEEIVNAQIKNALPVSCTAMQVDQAKEAGAIGIFEDKYAQIGDKINVYSIKGFSLEICGGPHVTNTKELGTFKILKEEAVAQGVRRIKATVTGISE